MTPLRQEAAPGAAADPALEAAFAGTSTIGTPAAARLLDMDIKTLQRHVAAGHLVGRLKGAAAARAQEGR